MPENNTKNLRKFLNDVDHLFKCQELLEDILRHWNPYGGINEKINEDEKLLDKIRHYRKFDDSE